MRYTNCECGFFGSGKHNTANPVENGDSTATTMNGTTLKPGYRDPVTTTANGQLTAPPTNGNAGCQHDLADSQSISSASEVEDADNLAVNEEVLREVADMCHCAMEDLEDVYPCTPLQEGMMALTFKDSTAYTVEYEYRLPPGTYLKQLQAAWQQTAQACPILRTRIVPTSKRGCLQAVVRAPIDWQVQEDDDGMRSPTDSVDWRAGAPLAYFTVNPIQLLLTVVIHHAICDDWSMALLLRQVAAAYRGECVHPLPFRPLIEYVQESRTRAESFWQDELRDAHESSMKTFPVQSTAGYVARPEARLLKTFAVHPESGADFTVNTKMRLAWALLESFYTGSHDNLFGAINAGRGVPVPGIEELCGPAITSVPVRIKLFPEHTVTEALAAAQHQWVAAMEFEHVGLQALRHLGPGPAAACQFQTLLAVEPREAHGIPQLFSQHRSIQRTYDLYPLILRCRPSADTMEIEARFDPAVIEEVQGERILHQLAHIYTQVDQRRYLTLRDIDPLCPEDRAQIGQWNQILEPSPTSRPCVHHLIHDRTQTQPQAPAISSWDGELSYQGLDDLSSALASRLSLHGIAPGVFVPLLVEKSKWRAVAMLAVMKAGGAFVLFDTSFPVQRLQEMHSQSKATLVVASEQHVQLASQLSAQVLIIDQPTTKQATMTNGHCPPHQPTVTPDDPVYATFTSGSTGTPKGVVVHHAGYAASSLAHGHPYHFTPHSRVLQFASPAFDSCIIEHISTLIAGGCVCIPSSDDCQSNLAQAMKRFAVDVACLTPTVARILTPEDLPSLKHMIFVGEAVLESDIARWSPYVEVGNAYGPAECSAVFSVQPRLQSHDSCNIGFPTGGVGWVVDPTDHRRMMPLGCTGELLIEGSIVGLGYLSNPEQTAQVFIEPPPWRHRFGATSRGYFYKTGDLVKRRGDGSFSYVGRKDTQVKLHGQRLELADVEHHLRAAFPQAEQAVAELLRFDRSDDRPDTVLTALIYIPSQIPLGSGEGKLWLPPSDWFRSACTAAESRMLMTMPRFMVPAIFLPLSHVPVTASGKTDRRQLREQATALTWDEMQAYRPAAEQLKLPTTTKEETLRSIWALILNRPVEGIGVSDSFFRLGGDSISAMQVTTSCRAAGFAVTVADIFQCPTITKLAQRIQQLDSSHLLTTGLEDQMGAWFSLSPIQRLFFEHAPNGHDQFTQQFLLRVAKPHTDSQLKEAVRMIVSRHSMLRARFQQQPNGQWAQSISKDVTDCSRFRKHRLPSIKYQGGMQNLLSDSRKMLDIRKGIMLVIDHIRTMSGEVYISLMAHHLVVDLVSWRVILQDLEDTLTTGSPLQQPTMSFQRWCQLQEAYCKKSRDRKQTALMDIPTPPSGYWGPGIARNGNTWACAVQDGITLPESTTQAILGPANDAFQTRPVEIIQAAVLGAFVEMFSDRPAPAIFSEGHGREPWDSEIDVSRTVGWFTTMVPLFVDAKKEQDITEVLQLTKEGRRAIPRNGWESFTSRYLHLNGAQHSQGHAPIELLFNYTGLFQQLERPNAHLQLAAVPDHDILPMPGHLPRFALIDVSATVMKGCLNLVFLYNRYSEHQDRLKQWMQACRRILEDLPHILQRLQRRTLSDFPLLSLTSDEQLQRLLHHISCKFDLSMSEIEDIYPCSPVQLGMWLSQMRKPDMYWSRMRWELSPSHSGSISVDITRVKKAWQQVVDRHAILRTVFTNGTGERKHPLQVVLKSVKADIEVHTKSSQPAQGCPQLHGRKSQKLNLRPSHRLALWSKPHGDVSCELNISHMLMDGVTGQTLLSDFLQAYNGLLSGVSGSPYRSYIAYLNGIETEGADAYWKEHLEGVNSCLLPSFGIPCDGVESHIVRSVPYDFGTGGPLHSFCQQHGITVSCLLQVAWGIVLRIYTGNESVCFGYLTSGRDILMKGVRDIAGPLINLLVCRLSLEDDTPTLSALLDNQSSHSRSIEHQHFSLAEVMHSLDLSGQPLFNTAMSLQRSDNRISTNASDVSMQEVVGHDETEYSLTVNVVIEDGTIRGDLTYSADTMGNAQAELIADTFRHVVLQLINPSNVRLGQLDLLSEKNGMQILERNRNVPPATASCIHTDIQKYSLEHPSAPAVCAWDGSLTYEELDRLSSSYAQDLLQEGVGPDVFVPICCDRSRWVVVAVLAALKAGGAFILLDSAHPAERLQCMVRDDFQCPVMVSDSSHVDLAARIASRVVVVKDDERRWLDNPQLDAPKTPVCPTNAAYAVFSSGSTGKPKATIIEHQSFRSAVEGHRKSLGLTEHSRVLQFASYAFDASIVEILTTLLVGGCVCIPCEADRQGRLGSVMETFKVTWALLTPSVAQVLDPSRIPSLKTLVLGGEGMSSDDVRRWSPYVHLMNAYGPSECSVIATAQPSSQSLYMDASDIGRPTGGVNWVVSPQDPNHLMPCGAVGELVIEGPIVGRGYVNRPEQMAAAFLPYPPWMRAVRNFRQGLLYRTGDLVRQLSDGSFRYIGRKDSQVKFHGQRIELGEVEHLVQHHFPEDSPMVFVDLVTLQSAGSEYLVASIFQTPEIADDAFEAAAAKTRASLQGQVPAFLIPSAFILLREIPRLDNGKIDRRQLRQHASQALQIQMMAQSEQTRNARPVPNLTVAEQQMQMLWCRVLGRSTECIAPDDNFFRLGGDSIGAMKLASVAGTEGLTLAVSDIFLHPVLRDLSLVLSSSQQTQPQSSTGKPDRENAGVSVAPFSLLPVEHQDEARVQATIQCDIAMDRIEDIYPSSALQAGLAAITAERPGAYIANHRLRLAPDVDLQRLKEAWHTVANSNPILRTRLIETLELGCLQVVVRDEQLRWVDYESNDPQPLREMVFGQPLVQLAISPAVAGYSHTTEADLILTMHHAMYDAWSLPRLLRDVQTSYRGPHSSCVEPAPFQRFVQYANWQKAEALEFWRGEFENLTAEPFPRLPSPSYRPRALKETQCRIHLDHSNGHSVTITTVVQLAWAIVQSQYQSSDEVIFGVVSAGRTSPVRGIETMTGPTIATIPLRVVIDADVTVHHALKQLQERTTRMVPFEQAGLHTIAALDPDAARACSFQTLINIEGRREIEDLVADLEVLQPVDTTWENGSFNTYAMQLTCRLKNDDMAIEASFDEHVVPAWQMQRVLDQFCHVLHQVHQQPETLLRDVVTINPQDIQMLAKWNAAMPPLDPRTVLETIEFYFTERPSAIAVSSWDGSLTYRELDVCSRDLASRLVSQGVGPGTYVPIYLERSRWNVVAAVAVLKAKAAFVLLETAFPLGRLRTICEEIRSTVIVTSTALTDKAGQLASKIVNVGQRSENGFAVVSDTQGAHANPRDALYAVFTSGSTGKPKGAIVPNGSFVTMIGPYARVMGLKEGSRVLHFASYAFDVSVLELLGTLCVGACVCILSDSERHEQLAPAIAKLQPSHAILTPSLSRVLTPSEFSSVQKLGLIGEAVRASDIEQWQGHLQLLNTYGPAECTVVYTMQPVPSTSSPANIGHSIAGATWVTDPRDPQRLAPIGAVGELLLHGPLVGSGYLNNPDQTAAAFIPAPAWIKQVFPGQNELGEGRMYRTGDLVRYQADGSLSFVGRRDFQVKLRGQRFELGEVEALVQQQFPGEVRDVVAEIVSPTSATKTSCLVAFISLRTTADISTIPSPVPLPLDVATSTNFADKVDSVKRRLEDIVPEYMLPSAFVPLREMPRTMGGKIDRKQLRDAVTVVTQQQLESFAPASRTIQPIISEAERTVQSIWARVLDLPLSKIGANDSFFRLGGDSISALQAVQEARALGIEHSVGDLFNWRTIREIAKRFAASYRPAQPTDDNVEAVYPCSPAQRGILLSQMRDSSSYAPHFIWKVHGDTSIDTDRLAAAWRQVVAHQPALRTAFRPNLSTDGQFDQVIFRAVEPPLVLLRGVDNAEDSSGVPAVLDRATVTNVTHHDGYAVPYQLTICTDQTGHVFCRLDINHAIIDATSVSVLERDLCRAYDEAPGIRESNSAYQNYIAFVQQQPQEPAREYWKSYLEGIQPFTLPAPRNTSDGHTADSLQSVEFTLPHRGSDIVSFCRTTDWTASNLLYFAWALSLGTFARADDIFFGTLTSGRLIPVPGIEEAVGQFSNMSVCRVRLTPDLSLDDVALDLQESYAHVLSYQTFPFVEIARAAGVSLDELASTAINVQYASQAGLSQEKSSIRLAEVKGVDPILQNIMVYVLFDQDGQLRVSMTYRASYVLPSLAKQLAEYFELAISTILQHPQATVGDLNLLSTRDQQRLCSWNGYIPDFRPNCVHELIRERAREQPDSLAISGWDGKLTYRELDDLASQLSVSLIDHGVASAQCIPLCFEKSQWTIVAMLAVMKAGATFVPLDPSQPLNRLIDICRRTNAKLILSSPAQAAFAKSLGQDVMKVGEHIRNPNKNYILPLVVDPDQPAYILFTSGSTGEPKGAIVPHSSYCYAAQTHIQAFSLDNTSRVLQISSYAFDVSVMEILSSLVAGATVCVISESEQSQMMTDGTWPIPVTHAFLTPSLAGSLDPAKVPWLKTMVLLGEPLSTSHITQWGASCNLLNAYGPTECAVINTVSPRLSSTNNGDPRNIGWGLNVRCWIVDPHDHNQLVPVGAVGELIMNGPAVGLGYLGDERTTSDIFIEPPAWLRDFHPDGAQWRLYKTGDLVRYEISDGSLRFEGRKDRQIKVRGQRVELEDVEYHIRCCFPGVKEVVIDQVMIRQGQGQGLHAGVSTAIAPRLVACIWRGLVNESNGVDGKVINSMATNGSPGEDNRTQDLLLDPSPEFHAAAATVLAQLREILPGYMIPDYFLPISKVPRTASGKTDRGQLCRRISAVTAEDWRALQDVQRSRRLPLQSATEEKLHAILVGLLGIPSESVGAGDSFFHLGGDSILAMKMAAKARAEGMDISSHDILRYPTISEWAEIVDAHPTRQSNHETYVSYSLVTDADRKSVLSSSYLAKEHPFTAANVEDIVPVVESQRFYVTHSSPVSMAELFPSGLDIGRLRKACSATVAHHSILRTFFAVSNERYFQVILRQVEFAFDVLECDDPEAYMSRESRRKLEPSTALWSMPVGFTVVVSRTHQNVVFIIRISHAQYDGPSLSILWNSIVAAYRGYVLEKAAQFKDVVYHRLGSDHEEAFSFWRKYLQDAPPAAWDPLNVTGISSSPENQANPTTVRQEIDQLGKLPEVTMATLVKAALAWTLSERCACSDIILGQVVHGRGGTLPDMDKVLGPCINILPIRIQINSHWTVLDFLRHVQAQQLVTVPHDSVSLNDIGRKCGTLDNPKFGCIVHHQGVQATQPLELDHNVRSSASLSWANSNPTSGQIGVISIERGSSLDLLITAPAEAMDQSTAELLGTKLADTIRLFFDFPNCPMTQLDQAAHTTSKALLS